MQNAPCASENPGDLLDNSSSLARTDEPTHNTRLLDQMV